jgi:hypothetical protein
MQRPDLNTLACVNPDCHQFRRPGEANLTVRKVYGHDYTCKCITAAWQWQQSSLSISGRFRSGSFIRCLEGRDNRRTLPAYVHTEVNKVLVEFRGA